MRLMIFSKALMSAGLSAVLVFGLAMAISTPAFADRFQTCVKSFWPAAKRAGVSWDTFQQATAGIALDKEVIESAKYQPEYKKPMGEYVERAISPKRLTMGQQKLIEYGALLDAVEAKYGVDKHIVLAIWGVESNYGTNKGDKHVIQSLMTLACSGTKAKFARGQIVSALKILQRGDTDAEHFNGSWAGAMGHTQFIPTTYSAYAVDFDGDGRRDIWDTIPDALGSTAAYLKKSRWKTGQTWGYEVKLPKSYTAKRYKRGTSRTLASWQKAGVKRVDGQPFPRPSDKAQLLSPDGRNGPSFLVVNNFRSLLRYNNADSYALAVGHLADRLAGYEPFVQAWPTSERRLSMEQRMELQRHLIALGHLEGDVDGIIGSGTLEGVRSYQRAKGMQVDGYPTQTILTKLQAEAPPPAPVAVAPTPQPAQPQKSQPQMGQPTGALPAPNGAQAQGAQPQPVQAQPVQPQPKAPQVASPQAVPPQAVPAQAMPPQAMPRQVEPSRTVTLPVVPPQAAPAKPSQLPPEAQMFLRGAAPQAAPGTTSQPKAAGDGAPTPAN